MAVVIVIVIVKLRTLVEQLRLIGSVITAWCGCDFGNQDDWFWAASCESGCNVKPRSDGRYLVQEYRMLFWYFRSEFNKISVSLLEDKL